MLTAAAIASTAALLAASFPSIEAHGYMLIPESQFSGSANSAWVVQIDPVWASDSWDGNNAGSVDTFTSLKSANNFVDLKTLMDDTSVYGADCGFTNPNGTPQPIPTDGKATFSRALVHVGPCEIWLDDKKVLSEDDCFSKYGNENQDIKSVFPVDYSSCDNGGCKEMRFYWLAFQGVDGKTVWQSYKDCIPLTGSGGSSTTATSQTSSKTGDEADSNTPTSGDSNTPSNSDSNTPSSDDSNSPSTNTPSSDDSNTPSSEDTTTQTSDDSNNPSSGNSNGSLSGESQNSWGNNPSSGESQNSWGNSATPAPQSTSSTSTWTEAPTSGDAPSSWSNNENPTTQGSPATIAPSFSFRH
ncbi:Mucin [Phytophthora megakarya]|uniref:Mucin n=1 Tax=Phytophthora megakarya TaxID=4795 RepID=A0A225V183_9STRA|nr:Mucin [Phytophthora megakarya]